MTKPAGPVKRPVRASVSSASRGKEGGGAVPEEKTPTMAERTAFIRVKRG